MALSLVGCSKMDSKEAINKYKKTLESNSKYTMTGQMSIISNEENYLYDVCVDYMEADYYKVSLVNKDNRHEQIILKNDNGVYVKTQESTKQKLMLFKMYPFIIV